MRDFPYERLVAGVGRHHRRILHLTWVLFVVSGLSLLGLRFDMDVLSQLPRSQVFQDYRAFLQSFGAYDSMIVLVTGEKEPIVEFADALAEKLRQMPEIGAVHYRIDLDEVRRRFLEPYRYQLLTEDDFSELSRRLEAPAIEARLHSLHRALSMPGSIGARRWILEDPIGVSEIVGRGIERRYADPLFRPSSEYFLSASGDALLMVVRPVESAFDTIFAERLLEKMRAAEGQILGDRFHGAGIEVGHTGSYVYAMADKQVIQRDFTIYFVFAPLGVLLIFHLGLRTWKILPFVTFPLLVTTAITFAVSLVLFRSLSMMSVAFAGIFYGLGIDSSIYFYSLLRAKVAARQPLGAEGLRQAVTETLRELGAANVVASTTTAVAFLVIGLSDFTGVSQLGLMTALAMMLNIVATFVLLPAMVFAWGPRAIPEQPAKPNRFAEGYARVAGSLAAHRRSVLALSTVLVLAAAWHVREVKLDTDFGHLRASGGEGVRVEELIRDRFGRVEVQGTALVRAGSAEEALRATERLSADLDRLREQGMVRSYSTLTAFVPSSETAERRLALFRALPRKQVAERFRIALERNGFDAGAFTSFLDDFVRDDGARLTLDSQAGGPLEALISQHLRRLGGETAVATYFMPAPGASLAAIRDRLTADLAGTPLVVTGKELVEGEFTHLLERELLWFLGGALVLNLAVVFYAERSFVRALTMLAPTLAALVIYLGGIGALHVGIDPINLIVLPLLIGLGVDDSVYLVAHIRFGGGLGTGARRGATPLLLAVATTVVGFGSLGLSRYPALSRLGWLAALGLSLCVIETLVLVPALIHLLAGDRAVGGSVAGRPGT